MCVSVFEGNKVTVGVRGVRALKSLNEGRLCEGGQRDVDRDSDTDDCRKEFVGGGKRKRQKRIFWSGGERYVRHPEPKRCGGECGQSC